MRSFVVLGSTLLVALLVAACTPVQPVQKIGLVAPFEGLYRESGYAALATVRMAIEDCAPVGTAVIPLALDTSARSETAQRTVAKLLADPALDAFVGPMTLAAVAAIDVDMENGRVQWIAPSAVDNSGKYAVPDAVDAWLPDYLITAVGFIAEQGAKHVVIAGLPYEWIPAATEVDQRNGYPIPVKVVPGAESGSKSGSESAEESEVEKLVDSVNPQGALLWLGSAHQGAQFAQELSASVPSAEFWMGAQMDEAVFTAHYQGSDSIYWLSYVDSSYTVDRQDFAPAELWNRQVYLATCTALSGFDSADGIEETNTPLRLIALQLKPDGTSSILSTQ